ncbi:hypothetical protein AVEN_17566-1 [Araneus ventricosus]|uniref:Malonyl-CoA:ACP transacylase (MAT) domain-containing protein n=1 Tax=Araneus ventricosus TaxID=182803 RepID=A0A4Y2HFC0_ARAVE|nr:hypothetical protein AVEN_17566-1 [Araneus ventricosus]
MFRVELCITWSQANKCCPKDISPACHNAEDSVTISGPKDSVKVFTDALKAENVFVREVDSCGYAFHSQYVLPAVGKFQTALEKHLQLSTGLLKSSNPDSNFSLQEACNKFDMTRVQACNKCANELTQAWKSPWDELVAGLPRQTHCKL